MKTHSQAPIEDREEFLLKEVEFDEAHASDASKLGIGRKGVAEGFRSNSDTCKDESVNGE